MRVFILNLFIMPYVVFYVLMFVFFFKPFFFQQVAAVEHSGTL